MQLVVVSIKVVNGACHPTYAWALFGSNNFTRGSLESSGRDHNPSILNIY